MSVDRHIFISNNGSKLDDLCRRLKDADARLNLARAKLEAAQRTLDPLREEEGGAWNEKKNVECLLNIWWTEYRDACRTESGQPKPDPFAKRR